MTVATYPLRPFLPADTMALRDLFAQAIEELTQDDCSEDQRIAWASAAEEGPAFGKRLADATTLVIQVNGDYLGFGSLKDNAKIDMLYVSPHYAGEGVGTALMDALEKIAAARGAAMLTVDASETAVVFFEKRGFFQVKRNLVQRDDEWLAQTEMTKALVPPGPQGASAKIH